MEESNYAYNLVMNLSYLPDFLQRSILKQRLNEFFSMNNNNQNEIINNALDVGPSIPFDRFSRLLKTWLISLTDIKHENRKKILSKYIYEVISSPQKLIKFNMDGMIEVFNSLDNLQKRILIKTIREVITTLKYEQKKRLLLLIPDNTKDYLI